MPLEIDLLGLGRASVTAPAGCGKTQLVVDSLSEYQGRKPVLVLTHTNAGAAALRARLQRARIPRASYRITTIDGFALRLISAFPARSGHDPRLLEINNARNDYPAIRERAARLLRAGHISETLRATYGRLMVDEYQDCSVVQHEIVAALADLMPTAVLGDPMQAIFGFAGNQLVSWQGNVASSFPSAGMLGTPWRWRNAGTEALGAWLLEARFLLQHGESVDLRTAPAEVQWLQLTPSTADQRRRAAAQTRIVDGEETVLIIGDSRNPRGRYQLTSQTPGATCVEAVDLSDLVSFARRFEIGSAESLAVLAEFAADVMTQVGAPSLVARSESLIRGRARNAPNPAETAAVEFRSAPSAAAALKLLDALEDQPNARVFRPELLYCCRSALRASSAGATTFVEAVFQARERNRHLGRAISRRAVGSTLLIKGLEADVAVLLHPETMDAPNLYVALTRGARRLVVCSTSPVLIPQVANR